MLAASRLLLGVGEGGGFPAATRAVAEWFPVDERATAMGIINAGTAVGAVVAPPLIALVLVHPSWFHLSSWRWVFFLTGGLGLLWTIWWWRNYFPPRESVGEIAVAQTPTIALPELLKHKEILGVVGAKFLSDAAWYFYLFWLPKYLFDAHHLDIKASGQYRLDSLCGVRRRLPVRGRAFQLAAGARLQRQLRAQSSRLAQARRSCRGSCSCRMLRPWGG